MKKQNNNDIPDQYHLDENQDQDLYQNFIPSYVHYQPFKENIIDMKIPQIMIVYPQFQEAFDQGFIQYPQQHQMIMQEQQMKSMKQKKSNKSKSQHFINQERQDKIYNSAQQNQQKVDGSEQDFLSSYNYEQQEKNEHEKLLQFQQTLTGFVLKLFEAHQNNPLSERYIVEQVRANIWKLKRPDGTKYKGNLYKTVKGSLTSNGIFRPENKRETKNGTITYWVVCLNTADDFKKRTIDKILTTIDKKKVTKKYPKVEDIQKDQLEHIKNYSSHIFGLLNGFIESQPNLTTLFSYIDNQNIEKIKQVYKNCNLDAIQAGVKEVFDSFPDLMGRIKNEAIQN